MVVRDSIVIVIVVFSGRVLTAVGVVVCSRIGSPTNETTRAIICAIKDTVVVNVVVFYIVFTSVTIVIVTRGRNPACFTSLANVGV